MAKRGVKDKGRDEPVFIIRPDSEMNNDWIRAARLKTKADKGDEEAAKELRRRERTRMVPVDPPSPGTGKDTVTVI